jgi:hypothetical protein
METGGQQCERGQAEDSAESKRNPRVRGYRRQLACECEVRAKLVLPQGYGADRATIAQVTLNQDP